MFYHKNLLQLHSMENEQDSSFVSQYYIMALLHRRTKLTTAFEICDVIIQNDFGLQILRSDGKCFDGTVS